MSVHSFKTLQIYALTRSLTAVDWPPKPFSAYAHTLLSIVASQLRILLHTTPHPKIGFYCIIFCWLPVMYYITIVILFYSTIIFVVVIIIISIITVFAGVLFVHQPGANHAPRASVTQVEKNEEQRPQETVGRLSFTAFYENLLPTVGRLSADCRPTVGSMSVICRPSVG